MTPKVNVGAVTCDGGRFQKKNSAHVDEKHVGERAAVPKCLSNLQLKLMSAPCARSRPACSHICCLQRGVAPRHCVQV